MQKLEGCQLYMWHVFIASLNLRESFSCIHQIFDELFLHSKNEVHWFKTIVYYQLWFQPWMQGNRSFYKTIFRRKILDMNYIADSLHLKKHWNLRLTTGESWNWYSIIYQILVNGLNIVAKWSFWNFWRPERISTRKDALTSFSFFKVQESEYEKGEVKCMFVVSAASRHVENFVRFVL